MVLSAYLLVNFRPKWGGVVQVHPSTGSPPFYLGLNLASLVGCLLQSMQVSRFYFFAREVGGSLI